MTTLSAIVSFAPPTGARRSVYTGWFTTIAAAETCLRNAMQEAIGDGAQLMTVEVVDRSGRCVTRWTLRPSETKSK